MSDAVEQAHREHWARLLALLVTRLRRFDLAEDALQDAFVEAARSWPGTGAPDNPAGWLMTAARRRAIDRLRREDAEQRRLPLLVTDPTTAGGETIAGLDGAPAITADGWAAESGRPAHGRAAESGRPVHSSAAESGREVVLADERLRMLFACCHPALPADGRAAMMLRFVAGLSTAEIARLFLVSESTMGARLTRAKAKMAQAAIPVRRPEPADLPQRLEIVRKVVYLLFTEGYRATSGAELTRPALAAEAIRLGRLLNELLPGDTETIALLALMLLQHARRDARADADGNLVRLADQDRSRWHHNEIAEARGLLAAIHETPNGTGQGGEWRGEVRRGEYLLQALIADAHCGPGPSDWLRVAAFYGELDALTGSPVVRLNRAVAVAEAGAPDLALGLLDGLDERLAGNHSLFAVRAELLQRVGDVVGAAAAFETAIALARTESERRHLAKQLAKARQATTRA